MALMLDKQNLIDFDAIDELNNMLNFYLFAGGTLRKKYSNL